MGSYICSVFVHYLYVAVEIKRMQQGKSTGIDPEVMKKSTSNVQQFMGTFTNILTVYAAVIILIHAVNLQYGSLFSRYDVLSSMKFDLSGFLVGLIGLSFCLYAQMKMGASWRVSIDEKVKTQLVTTGLYKFIRNPTYLGLFLLNIGFSEFTAPVSLSAAILQQAF